MDFYPFILLYFGPKLTELLLHLVPSFLLVIVEVLDFLFSFRLYLVKTKFALDVSCLSH